MNAPNVYPQPDCDAEGCEETATVDNLLAYDGKAYCSKNCCIGAMRDAGDEEGVRILRGYTGGRGR